MAITLAHGKVQNLTKKTANALIWEPLQGGIKLLHSFNPESVFYRNCRSFAGMWLRSESNTIVGYTTFN